MENLCSRVSAYLYVGASIQIAFSLGLHRDQLAESASNMEREQNRRIWWTLFVLDQELASRGGSPNIIDERFTKVATPMSSEEVRDAQTIPLPSTLLTRPDSIPWPAYATGVASHIGVAVSTET